MALYPVVPRDYQGWQQPVLDILNDPPVSPTEGQRYLLNTEPTGAWSGKAGQIATHNGTGWDYAVPSEGWYVYDIDSNTRYYFNGSVWASDGAGEANTASSASVGGQSIFYQKSSVDLQFKGLKAGSSKLTITDDPTNHNLDLDISEANIGHNSLSGYAAANHRAVNWNATTHCVEITI